MRCPARCLIPTGRPGFSLLPAGTKPRSGQLLFPSNGALGNNPLGRITRLSDEWGSGYDLPEFLYRLRQDFALKLGSVGQAGTKGTHQPAS
jgi:hypothetical protein